jgi:hypothetical protein
MARYSNQEPALVARKIGLDTPVSCVVGDARPGTLLVLYYGDVAPRRYRCTACETSINVTRRPLTIEALPVAEECEARTKLLNLQSKMCSTSMGVKS